MSLSSRITTSTPQESEFLLLNTLKQIYNEYERHELPIDKVQILREKLYQIWMRPQTMSNSIHRINEGYRVVEYLEQLILDNKMNDHFFILTTSTIAKNQPFFRSLLNNHQRFKQLFTSSSIRKPICLMRYIELLYFYCPSDLISTIGLEFYRFVVDTYLLNYLRQKQRDIDWLAAFSTLLYHFYENTTKKFPSIKSTECIFTNQKDAIDYSIYVIDTLLNHHLKIKIVKDLIYDTKLIDTITKVIALVWDQNPSSDSSTQENLNGISPVQFRSIEYLFTEMSNNKSARTHVSMCSDNSKTTFSSAILSLFSHIPLDAAEIILKTMFSDGRLNGERLSTMIKYLIELIEAPTQFIQHMPYETWVVGLCMTLITFNQHEYLVKTIDETTSFLIEHLFYLQTYDNAIQILFWFVRYDKRITTFLLILDRLPKLFEKLKTSNNEDLKTKLIELCHMGIAIHPEYNISNEIVLKQIIYSLPQPDLNILSNHKNIHAKYHSVICDNETKIKNRVGIINLGNTCYVNSVLQALYQCNLFRKYILEHYFDEQVLLRELQIIFAQLNLSKRSLINAANLVKIARPAWFSVNEQQDCAEFLGYLLDTIKDEEKKDKKISSYEIERLFTIRTSQVNRCQRCSMESFREESSNYLFLPIPTSDNQNENLNYNQSATPITMMRNGLKFYAASNGNSSSDDQARSVATSLVHSSGRSRSPPPPYNSTTVDQTIHSSNNDVPSLNLQLVFDRYFEQEELKDDNQYRCEHCRSLQDAQRYTILQTAPEYLILSLNRFEYDKRTNIFRKVFTKMNYPKVLNVHVYPSQNSRNNPILTKYCLVLVIVHTGYTLHGGHYYVYAREIKPSLLKTNTDEQEDYFSNDEWFLLNDDLVTLSSYEAMIENCAQYTSATPYVLIYKRIDEQRIEEMERTKQIHVHESLIHQIHEDNMIYEREQEKQST